jgi:hypothetical protein
VNPDEPQAGSASRVIALVSMPSAGLSLLDVQTRACRWRSPSKIGIEFPIGTRGGHLIIGFLSGLFVADVQYNRIVGIVIRLVLAR